MTPDREPNETNGENKHLHVVTGLVFFTLKACRDESPLVERKKLENVEKLVRANHLFLITD